MNPFSDRIKGFFSDNKHLWVIVVIAAALFGGGLATGRYMLPPATIVTEKIHEVVRDKIVEVVKTEVKVVKVQDQETIKKLHREISELKKPDGTYEKKVIEDLNINDVVHTNTNTVEIKYVDKVVEKWSDKIIEKEKKVLSQPDWSVYAGVGIDIPHFLGQSQNGVPGMQGLVVQAGIDRRVIGPFAMGLFGNTEGVAGVNLRVSW